MNKSRQHTPSLDALIIRNEAVPTELWSYNSYTFVWRKFNFICRLLCRKSRITSAVELTIYPVTIYINGKCSFLFPFIFYLILLFIFLCFFRISQQSYQHFNGKLKQENLILRSVNSSTVSIIPTCQLRNAQGYLHYINSAAGLSSRSSVFCCWKNYLLIISLTF